MMHRHFAIMPVSVITVTSDTSLIVRRDMLYRMSSLATKHDFRSSIFACIKLYYANLSKLTDAGKEMRRTISSQFIEQIKKLEWILAIETNNTVVGFAGVADGTPAPSKNKLIVWIFVAPERRGSGIGRQLINAVDNLARNDKFSYVCLGAGVDIEVFRFALACGFSFPKRRVFAAVGDTFVDVDEARKMLRPDAAAAFFPDATTDEIVDQRMQLIQAATAYVQTEHANTADFMERFGELVKTQDGKKNVTMVKLVAAQPLMVRTDASAAAAATQ